MLWLEQVEYAAAKMAVENWHYSRRYPGAPVIHYGVYDPGFVGVVIFGKGATPEIGKPFGLPQSEVCELTRVALTDHETPTSRIVAVALRLLHRDRPGIRLVVSFADEAQGHVGTIYQASNWIYLGAKQQHAYLLHGALVHPRTLYTRYGTGGQSMAFLRTLDPNAARVKTPQKHKYVYPFDRSIPLVGLPYPKTIHA